MKPKPLTELVLLEIVRKHYEPITNPHDCDGAQMWNGQWWMPLSGCDTLSNMINDMVYAVRHASDPE